MSRIPWSRQMVAIVATLAVSALLVPAGSVGAPTAPPRRPPVYLIGDSTMLIMWYYPESQSVISEAYQHVPDFESCRTIIARPCRGRFGYAPLNVIDTMKQHDGGFGEVMVVMAGYDDSNIETGIDVVMAEARRQGVTAVLWLTYTTQTTYVGRAATASPLVRGAQPRPVHGHRGLSRSARRRLERVLLAAPRLVLGRRHPHDPERRVRPRRLPSRRTRQALRRAGGPVHITGRPTRPAPNRRAHRRGERTGYARGTAADARHRESATMLDSGNGIVVQVPSAVADGASAAWVNVTTSDSVPGRLSLRRGVRVRPRHQHHEPHAGQNESRPGAGAAR